MPDLPGLVERARQVTLDQPETLGAGDCEALRSGWIGQPVNTVTSFAFVGAGAWLASRVGRLPRGSRPGALAYAALAVATGAGSIAYHGPQFAGAQFLHDAPILGVAAIGAVVPIWRASRGRTALPGWSSHLGVAMAATAVVSGVSYAAGSTSSPMCRPDSLLQPHGLWHIGTAAVMAMWATAVWAPEVRTPEEPADREGDGVADR